MTHTRNERYAFVAVIALLLFISLLLANAYATKMLQLKHVEIIENAMRDCQLTEEEIKEIDKPSDAISGV